MIYILAPNFCPFREDDGGNLITGMSNMTKKDVPLEIMLIDSELKEFFSLDITAITREGKLAEGTGQLYFWYYLTVSGDKLTLKTDEMEMVWTVDMDQRK